MISMDDSLFTLFDSDLQKDHTSDTKRSNKKQVKKADTTNSTHVNTKSEQETNTLESECNWVQYTKESRPAIIRPCMFRVKIGSKYSNIYYGYISQDKILCTNDTYLIHIKNKYGNMEFSYIHDCLSVDGCPNGYPNCKKCKKRK